MKKLNLLYCLVPVLIVLSIGCTRLDQLSTDYQPLSAVKGEEIVVTKGCPFILPTGIGDELREGTRWRMVGTSSQGNVYKPVGHAFAIHDSNMYEAWLVLKGKGVAGFYLPVQDKFSPLSPGVELEFKLENNGG